jgi:hypothetical protein
VPEGKKDLKQPFSSAYIFFHSISLSMVREQCREREGEGRREREGDSEREGERDSESESESE